jgi:hypothetical protein
MSTNDEIFAGEAEIDEQVRLRSSGNSKPRTAPLRSSKSGQSSQALDRNDEEQPLLGTGASSRGRAGSDGGSEPEEWFGTAELKGLPWWKKPSVRERSGYNPMSDADATLIRYSGYYRHSSCSQPRMAAS